MNPFHLPINKKQLPTMYKNNSRNRIKHKGCSLLQLLCDLQESHPQSATILILNVNNNQKNRNFKTHIKQNSFYFRG